MHKHVEGYSSICFFFQRVLTEPADGSSDAVRGPEHVSMSDEFLSAGSSPSSGADRRSGYKYSQREGMNPAWMEIKRTYFVKKVIMELNVRNCPEQGLGFLVMSDDDVQEDKQTRFCRTLVKS